MSYNYAVKVFNGDKYICVITSKHSNYDNVIWWQLETLIDAYRNKEISKNIFEETIEYETKYFEVGDDYVDLDYISKKIDFFNETITLPSYPIYTFKEIEDAFPVPIKVIKKTINIILKQKEIKNC